MRNNFKLCISIQYDSEDEARIIFSSLIPEMQENHFDRSETSMVLKSQKIEISIMAKDFNAAKATISSILRWVSSTTKALNLIKTNF